MIFNPHLEGDPFFWQAGPTGVLLVHGLTATAAEVRPLAVFLHQAGFTIAAPLLPGHYTKPADLNTVRWQDWAAQTEDAYARLGSVCTTVAAGGESTGALLALELAARHPEIAALLLYAPALRLKMSAFDALRIRIAAPFTPWLPKPNLDEGSGLWQGYRVNPLRGVIQLLQLQSHLRHRLAKIDQPTLIVQGKLDQTVHPDAPEMIRQRLKSSDVEIHWMERSTHCVILDTERTQVNEITLAFLERILGSAQQ